MKKHHLAVVPGIFAAAVVFSRLAGPMTAHADTVIDSFQYRPANFPLTQDTSGVGVLTSIPGVIGGRAIALGAFGANGISPATVDILNTDGLHLLQYSSTNTTAEELHIQYGATSLPDNPGFSVGNYAYPLGLTVDPASAFLQLVFAAYNHANGQDIALDTTLGTGLSPYSKTFLVASALSTPGAQILDIPLSELPGNTLDFVSFDFQAPAGTNFQLSSITLITPVPEPATAALFGISMTFLIRRKMRH